MAATVALMRTLMAVFIVPLLLAGVFLAWFLADVPGLIAAVVVLVVLALLVSRAAKPRRVAVPPRA